jgi:hypothetical protein
VEEAIDAGIVIAALQQQKIYAADTVNPGRGLFRSPDQRERVEK